jgi:hypothetical protein
MELKKCFFVFISPSVANAEVVFCFSKCTTIQHLRINLANNIPIISLKHKTLTAFVYCYDTNIGASFGGVFRGHISLKNRS